MSVIELVGQTDTQAPQCPHFSILTLITVNLILGALASKEYVARSTKRFGARQAKFLAYVTEILLARDFVHPSLLHFPESSNNFFHVFCAVFQRSHVNVSFQRLA